jgi:hypothetical protein
MKKLGGFVLILLGVGLLGWLGYNFFIEMQPVAEGRSPIPPLIFSAALIGVGTKWALSKPKKQ